MEVEKDHYSLSFDPRTKLFLLLVSNLLLFIGAAPEILYVYIAFLGVMLCVFKLYIPLMVFGIMGIIQLGMAYIIFPVAPKLFVMIFSVPVHYGFRMFPCLMAGAFLVSTTSLHDVVLAMRKFSLPQRIIIPLSVTIRYFPAIFEELRHISQAMKLRKIPITAKIECYVVPFMMAASTTVEELSAAAVTRGIENPAKKTSVVRLNFSIQDYLMFTVGVAFLIVAFML
jgi:energy-coupling factor transporter transmembrane protein EcfT